MSILDLEAMSSRIKQADLVKIFLAVTDILSKEGFEHQSKLAQLTSLVETGQLDEQLKNIVLVVDGFSRFSAEEEALVSALNERVSEILIGVYASKKAVQSHLCGRERLSELTLTFYVSYQRSSRLRLLIWSRASLGQYR